MRAGDYIKPDEPMPVAAFRFARDYLLTEENSDIVIAKVGTFLDSSWLKWVPFGRSTILSLLDKMFPEKAIEILSHLMISSGLTTERELAMVDSPFSKT